MLYIGSKLKGSNLNLGNVSSDSPSTVTAPFPIMETLEKSHIGFQGHPRIVFASVTEV